MSEIKITAKRVEPYHIHETRRSRQRKLPGHCQICGAVLTSKKSLDLGIGHRCNVKTPVIVILRIPAAAED